MMQYRFISGLVMFACAAALAQEPPAVAGSPDLSFFDFLGSMVADDNEGWIDPLDLYENYEAELALIEHDASQAVQDGVQPSEEVGEDE